MNLKTILVLLMIYSLTLSCQQNIPVPNTGATHVVINLNTANTAGLTQQNQLDQHANHTSTQRSQVKTDTNMELIDPDFKKKIYDFYQEQSKMLQESYADITTWTQMNKLKSLGIMLLLGYSCITYQIYRSNLIINDSSSWSNWHNGRTVEDLFTTPQNKLEADLLFAIQTRYVHPINPTDFIYSIVQSSNSLQEEMKVLEEQITRYKRIKSLECMPLFFITDEDLDSLQEKNRKLAFLKYILSSWCANYKIDKNS
jgi:hypothetical protein